jgi:hypothetical protein
MTIKREYKIDSVTSESGLREKIITISAISNDDNENEETFNIYCPFTSLKDIGFENPEGRSGEVFECILTSSLIEGDALKSRQSLAPLSLLRRDTYIQNDTSAKRTTTSNYFDLHTALHDDESYESAEEELGFEVHLKISQEEYEDIRKLPDNSYFKLELVKK